MINLLVAPAMSLQPILVTRHFGGDAGSLALIEAAFGIGVIVGGVALGVWGNFKRRIYPGGDQVGGSGCAAGR
ncbi:MAG: MFS transporter [Oscillochloris sp.]|nr:MFS transporter [Oscillochloris sp.]